MLMAAWLVLAGHLVSTFMSPSIPVSLWGSEPALDGNGFYNTLSHFLLFWWWPPTSRQLRNSGDFLAPSPRLEWW
jgi:hypothetical protein